MKLVNKFFVFFTIVTIIGLSVSGIISFYLIDENLTAIGSVEGKPFLILLISIISLITLLLLLLVARFFLFKRIVEPLDQQIEWLKNSNIFKDPPIFEPSTIVEFQELNYYLKGLFNSIKESYVSQKQYSENLSHELLTPLAIIRSKIEILLQSEKLEEDEVKAIDTIIHTVGRLSNLNKGLILLSKIDNNQFIDITEVNINEVIVESLENFEDQIRVKDLTIRVEQTDIISIATNVNLINILISNLIKNAVFHNLEGGYLKIVVSESSIFIENSGNENKISTEDLFNRFVTSRKSRNSIGLGLSIVSKICSELGFKVNYTYDNMVHKVLVDFKGDKDV